MKTIETFLSKFNDLNIKLEVEDEVLEKQLAYWSRQLNGSPELLELPADYPRPAVMRHRGKHLQSKLNRELTERIKQLSRQNNVTLFMTLFAAFNVLLSRYSGQNDLVVGSPDANHTHTADMIEFSVNTLVLRTRIKGEQTFNELLKQVKQTTLEAYNHSDIPFEYLVEQMDPTRSTSHSPLFQVMFVFQNTPDKELEPGGLNKIIPEPEKSTAKFDLTLNVTEQGEVLVCDWGYRTDLFCPDTITRMTGHFQVLLEGILNTPEQSISQLPLLNKTEQQQLLVWNQTDTPTSQATGYHCDKTIVDLFQEQVEKTPDNIAVVFPSTSSEHCEDQQLTYSELNRKSNQLANYLLSLKSETGNSPLITDNSLIGICVERSLDMVIGITGILKAGAAYVPLDPDYPVSRLQFMLHDSSVPVLLSRNHLLKRLPASKAKVICLDSDRDKIAAGSMDKPEIQSKPDDLAYVIYTSGSTGEPKGVSGTHKGMVNRLSWMWKSCPFEAEEVCCHRSSINFVDHVAELFSPLLKGVPLVLFTGEKMQNTVSIINMLHQYKTTRFLLVPSLLRSILEQENHELLKLTSVKYWFCSGEALPARLVKVFYEKIPEGALFNIYGSTEVSADVSVYKVERQDIVNILNYFSTEYKSSNYFSSAQLSPESITTPGVEIEELKLAFKSKEVPLLPQEKKEYYAYLKEYVLPYLINTSSPRFIGHMTSVLPSFNFELTDLISRLNQNMVKVETSKSLVFLERQAMAMLHHAFYNYPESFYEKHSQQAENSLGITVSGGSMANVSALWVARNRALPPDDTFPGAAQAGIIAALSHYKYKNIVLLGSRLMHYSIQKAVSLLGLGIENIVYVEEDENGKMDIDALKQCIEDCRRKQWCIIALMGIAGATETGNIDPLDEMAEIAEQFNIHFHVDAAWGGPVVFSNRHKGKLKGIEKADSITLCGHKQLYLPMGISFCLFKQPDMVKAISISTAYQARKGGYDFGQYSPEGSRSSLSLCLHAAFHLIGKQGYAKLIDDGIDKAQYLKERLLKNDAFELMRKPVLNIVNFRYIPVRFRDKLAHRLLTKEDNIQINNANVQLQEMQFKEGRSFFSRTKLSNTHYTDDLPIDINRAVLTNPLTTYQDIDFVVEDLLAIAAGYIENDYPADKQELSNLTSSPPKRDEQEEFLDKYTIPIGKPAGNTNIYILDTNQKPVPVGVSGELHVSGVGLASGYLNRPELTAGKFIQIEIYGKSQRFYKTGDLARWLPDGNIEYIGRLDHQVKLRGFRIELSEIEATLSRHDKVKEAVVTLHNKDNNPRLVAYVTVTGKQLTDNEQTAPNDTFEQTALIPELHSWLKTRLPEYMLPSDFNVLNKFPLTPGGKIDRRALSTLNT